MVPGYHYFAGTLALLNLIWAIYRAVTHPTVDTHAAIVVAVLLLLMLFYLRAFPLAVQDRLIRLEERMRLARLMPAQMQSRCGLPRTPSCPSSRRRSSTNASRIASRSSS